MGRNEDKIGSKVMSLLRRTVTTILLAHTEQERPVLYNYRKVKQNTQENVYCVY